MELAWYCCQPKQRPLFCSIFLSFIGLWVNIWHRNKIACSESNPVQSSRSKSRTCLRKGRLLRFKMNSTATSAGGAKKLGNYVWHDSNRLWRLQPNLSQIECDLWKQCSDQRWQNQPQISIWRFFEQYAFVNNHLLCYWPTIHNSISKIWIVCPKF